MELSSFGKTYPLEDAGQNADGGGRAYRGTAGMRKNPSQWNCRHSEKLIRWRTLDRTPMVVEELIGGPVEHDIRENFEPVKYSGVQCLERATKGISSFVKVKNIDG
uniref:(northern house mosquito) hypothetical protein n=1 Tax=Culex pipiens TaxID=7175 RepID=A0A8D8H2G1_CULPI